MQYPGDTRTLYYLAYAHLEIFLPNRNDPQPEHWEHLQIAVDYLTERIGIEAGNVEEKWFTYLKLGEIYDRFYKKWDVAKKYYIGCTEDDPERADPFFYIGQHYRLRSDHKEAIKWLAPAARKSMPARSLFQWHSLYHCLAAVEYARALKIAAERKDIQMEEVNEIVELLAKADCSRESGSERNDIGTLRSFFAKQYARMTGGAAFEKLEIIRRLDTITAQHYDTLDRSLDAISLIDLSVDKNFDIVVTEDEEWNKDADTSHSLWSLMEEKLSPALQYLEDLEELKEKNVGKDLVNPPPKRTKREKSRRKSKKKGKKAGSDEDADLIAWHKKNSCRSFRRATKEYTRFFSKYQDVLAAKITPDSVYQKLATITTQIIDLCR